MHVIMVVLTIGVFSGSVAQKFKFDSGLQYNASCGPSPKANWSAEGSVTLTAADFVAFKKQVVIHAVQQLCTVDLTSCPPDHPPTTGQSCYCMSRVNDQFNIHVGAQATLAQAGMALQAVVPGHGALENIYGAATIGTFPNLAEITSSLNISYVLNEGPSRNLNGAQTIAVCPNERFTFEICVANGTPNADLTIKVGKKVNTVSDENCVAIIHKLKPGQDRTLVFEYKEGGEGCTLKRYINFTDDALACSNPSGRANITAKTTTGPTEITTKTTTTTPRTTTERKTTANQKEISGVCPDTPRTLTTLPNGVQTLTDDVSLGGNWTVFQRRVSAKVDFYRNWTSYESGFGNMDDSFWLGLRNIYEHCNKESKCELLVHLKYPGTPSDSGLVKSLDDCYNALYTEFWLGPPGDKYRLHVNGYKGTAGNSLEDQDGGTSDGMMFSTYDNTNDQRSSSGDCASTYKGAWWYNDCHRVNLNAKISGESGSSFTAAEWHTLTGWNSVVFSEMKMRRLA